MLLLISEEEAVGLLRDVLRLSHPVSIERVREEVTFLSNIWNDRRDPEFAQTLKTAKESLEELAENGSDIFKKLDEVPSVSTTVDGTPIAELGYLEPIKKRRRVIVDEISRCLICKGKGYKTLESPLFRDCTACLGVGEVPKKLMCKYCTDGIFTLPNGMRTTCKKCNGSRFKNHPFLKQPCRLCRATGQILDLQTSTLVSYKCNVCSGSGKIF